ncbi:hypothetical protein [Thauera linaloolentis]|uniref:hypothetical protein n=1 Tax=Thauera linaloolentis TaxID=76112 RepID=UPI000A56342C|nr:hypothetical protein [Thauera linaloolentis]MCM8565789.1 hypothetical protein [Thauera linaloolentis]
MTFIEISQDGAGLSLYTDASQVGFYTEDVATCIAYAFLGEGGLLAVHDSGQLSLQSFRTQVAQIGPVRRVICAQNKSQERSIQTKAHQERRNRLLNLIQFKKKVEKVDLPDGAIFLTNDGFSLNESVSGVTRIPDKERRLMINTLNNLFSPTNSQLLPIDVQYKNGSYTPSPNFLLSPEEMKARADHEQRRGDSDYWFFLNRGRDLGLL